MIEIILSFVIFALLIVIIYQQYSSQKERNKLIDFLMSRDLDDYKTIKIADKIQPKKEEKKVKLTEEPDLIPENQITEDQFKKVIEAQLNG